MKFKFNWDHCMGVLYELCKLLVVVITVSYYDAGFSNLTVKICNHTVTG